MCRPCATRRACSFPRPFFPMTQELTGDIEITRAQNRNYALAEGFHRMAKTALSWSLFLRYQAQAERHYRRAIEEFERLKALKSLNRRFAAIARARGWSTRFDLEPVEL